MNGFKDHFSGHAQQYAAARPGYPDALFAWLAQQSPQHQHCWDCASGNGQAALALSHYFKQVIATDASSAQIEQAPSHSRIDFRVGSAERSGVPGQWADLISVAQAAHWFDHPAFYREAERVARPGALLAIWGYGRHQVSPAVDGVMDHYYFDITGPYWPPERHYLDDELRTLPFPYAALDTPAFEMRQHWDLTALLAYLESWSATQRYRSAHPGEDPLDQIRTPLRAAWGAPSSRKWVRWPLYLRATHLNGAS